jgi:hypothetical protein
MTRTTRLVAVVVAFGSWACGGSGGGAPFGESGGATGTAPISTGGSPGTGGAVTAASGGAPAVLVGTGGAATFISTGGAPGAGRISGVVSTGGSAAVSSTGGAVASGGATASAGGQPGSGGSVTTGGAPGSGGTQAASGGSGTGGAAQTGGAPGTGGVTASGGANTGIISTGGAAPGNGGATMAGTGGMFSLPPPPVNPAPANSSLEFEFTDSCIDGETYAMRYFDEDAGFVWPLNALSGGVYSGGGDGMTDKLTLACVYGDKICFGAEPFPAPNGKYWGVDVDNSQSCIGCCHLCGQITPVTFNLTCI